MGYLAVIYLTPRTGKHPEDITNDTLHCTPLSKASSLSLKGASPVGDQDFNMNYTFLPFSDSP